MYGLFLIDYLSVAEKQITSDFLTSSKTCGHKWDTILMVWLTLNYSIQGACKIVDSP